MKKFLTALLIAFLVTANNFSEAAEFNGEQIKRMFSVTVQNPAVAQVKTLKLDAETFRKNFNDYIANFIREMNLGGDGVLMNRLLTIDAAAVTVKDDYCIFGKNFGGKVVIVGFGEKDKNLKVLNFFAAKINNRDDALFYSLMLDAFVKSISPDLDAKTLLDELDKNSDATLIRGGVKYSVTKDADTDIITAVAAP